MLAAVREARSGIGISVDELLSALHPRCSERGLRTALAYLSEEGHVYATIDDEHFLATEGQEEGRYVVVVEEAKHHDKYFLHAHSLPTVSHMHAAVDHGTIENQVLGTVRAHGGLTFEALSALLPFLSIDSLA